MALKSGVRFEMKIRGDGTDNTIVIVLATAPMVFIPPGSSGGFSATFDVTRNIPTAVADVSATGLTTQSATLSLLNTVLTVVFTAALGNGSEAVLVGTLLF